MRVSPNWPVTSTTNCRVVPDVDISKRPATTPFHRTDFDWDRFKFVVNTGPLFRNMPDPGKMPINALSLADLKSASKYGH
jgi:hypothetical protein